MFPVFCPPFNKHEEGRVLETPLKIVQSSTTSLLTLTLMLKHVTPHDSINKHLNIQSIIKNIIAKQDYIS